MLSKARVLCAIAVLMIVGVCSGKSAFALKGDAATVERSTDGLVVRNSQQSLRISVCGPGILHIVASPVSVHEESSENPWIVGKCDAAPFSVEQSEREVRIKTSLVQAVISLRNSTLSFVAEDGAQLLQESGEPQRSFVPVTVNGEQLYRATDSFSPDETEGMYGLGQHQSGAFNYRGEVVKLAQQNTDVAVPLLISTKGYGVLWNTASPSEFDNRFPRNMSFTASAVNAVDYYFLYGPEADQIIHEYRDLTGHSPMLGKWAYGFVQSKDRYTSAGQLLKIGEQYRSGNVPLDLIVQDWFWWKHQGDPEYSDDYLKEYPDVPGALQKLHEENFHAVISVWPRLDEKSATYSALKSENGLIPGVNIYDPTNPHARDIYWNLLPKKLLAQGWDGFWLDASEPEADLSSKQLFMGNGARYANVFPLLHTGNIYSHWRAEETQKRVFILTRSAFLGQQRNAAVTWSGDIYGTYTDFSRQVPAGLNFAISGNPYWTTDIGGYTSPYDEKSTKYHELYTRWYEYGAFCSIFRTHGHRDNNEVFAYEPVTPILVEYDKLRYRMLPYIYSLAWRVTNEDYTIQRPLVMDWRTVEKVRDIGDEFMFGTSVLVSPITVEGATSRSVYLPPGAGWFDFWTGKKLGGDQRIQAEAPLNRIPIYIRAGSILPLGPEVQYASQRENDPITVRIYRGADASFSWYDDSGDSYAYEKGERSITPLHWDEASGVLHIGAREGSFPGMKKDVTFRVVWVGDGHGVGEAVEKSVDSTVPYNGGAVTVKAPAAESTR